MNNPSMTQAEEAAELLGVSAWDLAIHLRYAAADELEALARRIRRNEDERLDVGRARRLLRASHAALAASDSVAAAHAEPVR